MCKGDYKPPWFNQNGWLQATGRFWNREVVNLSNFIKNTIQKLKKGGKSQTWLQELHMHSGIIWSFNSKLSLHTCNMHYVRLKRGCFFLMEIEATLKRRLAGQLWPRKLNKHKLFFFKKYILKTKITNFHWFLEIQWKRAGFNVF